MKSAFLIANSIVSICFFILCPAVIRAQSSTGDVYVLVRLTDYKGAKTFKSASLEEFRELSRAAKQDNDALPEAYNNLRKNWKKAETKVERRTVMYGRQRRQVDVRVPAPPFPLKCPEPREVRQMGTFASMDELNKLKQTLETRETDRVEKLTKEKEKKEADADSSTQGGLKRPPIKPPANQRKAVAPGKEAELMETLIKEIETIQAASEAAGGSHAAAGGGNRAKSSRPIRRMGQ